MTHAWICRFEDLNVRFSRRVQCHGLVDNLADFYPEAKWAALRDSLLPGCLDGGANRQGEGSRGDAEGDPCLGRRSGSQRKARQVVEKLRAMDNVRFFSHILI